MAWPVERCLYDGPCGCQEINSPLLEEGVGRPAGSVPGAWREQRGMEAATKGTDMHRPAAKCQPLSAYIYKKDDFLFFQARCLQ